LAHARAELKREQAMGGGIAFFGSFDSALKRYAQDDRIWVGGERETTTEILTLCVRITAL
jgi:hypothetical protein